MWFYILIYILGITCVFAQPVPTCDEASIVYQSNGCCDDNSGNVTYPCDGDLLQCQQNLLNCTEITLEQASRLNAELVFQSICTLLQADCFNATFYETQCAVDFFRLCRQASLQCETGFETYSAFERTRETNILVEFHNEVLPGSTLFNSGGWPTGAPCTESMPGTWTSSWLGVECETQTGFVKGFNFANRGITATINSMLSYWNQIPRLQVFSDNFEFNFVNGTINGDFISCMKNLEVFAIRADGESLLGTVPSEFGDLENLKNFRLDQPAMTGTVPSPLLTSETMERLTLKTPLFVQDVSAMFGKLDWTTVLLESLGFTGTLTNEFCTASSGFAACDLRNTSIACGSVTSNCCDIECP